MNKKPIIKLVLFSILALLVLSGCSFSYDMGRREVSITNASSNAITSITFDGRELVDASGIPYTISAGGEIEITLEFITEGSHSMVATDSSSETDSESVSIDGTDGDVVFFETETTIAVNNNTGDGVAGFCLSSTYESNADLNDEDYPASLDSEYWVGSIINIFAPIADGSSQSTTVVDYKGFSNQTLYLYAYLVDTESDFVGYVYQGTVTVSSGESHTFTASIGY